jgi:transcriptional regulator with XRE-family HTH domain
MAEHRPPLTQQAVAERVGVRQGSVWNWLTGAVPHPSTLNKLCLTLGVRRDWLLYGEGEKYLPDLAKLIVQEMPPTYSRREKITFIEENMPELLPLVDAFLDSMRKQLDDEGASKPKRKVRQSSQ